MKPDNFVLVGKVSGVIINQKEPTQFFPTLYRIYDHVAECSAFELLFPTDKSFADYLMTLYNKCTEGDMKRALEDILQRMWEEGNMSWEDDSEEQMWDDMDTEFFSDTIFKNFKELHNQFLKDIGK